MAGTNAAATRSGDLEYGLQSCLRIELPALGQSVLAKNRAKLLGVLRSITNHLQAKVTFCQGDWTCTLSRLSTTTEFDVCTVTQSRNGEVVEQKVFYDFRGPQQ